MYGLEYPLYNWSVNLTLSLSLLLLVTQAAREEMFARRRLKQYESDRKCVLDLSQEEEERLSGCALEEEKVAAYAAERVKRVEKFIALVRARREQFVESFCPTV